MEKNEREQNALLALLLFYFYCFGEFSPRHLEQFQTVFVEVLRRFRETGLLKFRRLPLDRTEVNDRKTSSKGWDRCEDSQTFVNENQIFVARCGPASVVSLKFIANFPNYLS